VQLQCLIHCGLFASGNIRPDRFGGTFDGFGGYFEAGE
jgi:hypothetical protein